MFAVAFFMSYRRICGGKYICIRASLNKKVVGALETLGDLSLVIRMGDMFQAEVVESRALLLST